MTLPNITFSSLPILTEETIVLLANDKIEVSAEAEALVSHPVLKRAAAIAGFTGKLASSVELIAPAETDYERVVAVGVGSGNALTEEDWTRIGGAIYAATRRARDIAVVAKLPEAPLTTDALTALVLGILIRSYSFDKYRTVKPDDEAAQPASDKQFTILCADPDAAQARLADIRAIAEGVLLARDLVNEPANILGTLEFAGRAKELEQLGVEIEILTEPQMVELGMGALLGVAQGSIRPPLLVIMRWNGGDAGDVPAAFVGKGVVFDSGGISIKPAAGMEDMKGDMGGAAAVVGLMHVLAARKARANVVGVIGLVENMVDGNAQRPGDIVTSMSGQTIEILNTDAEGRLVLADALWYTNQRFNPRVVIDLATLTGAIIVALGHEHAGLYANDEGLAAALIEAGHVTGEKLWRMPLSSAYDKLIDSKIADVKNIGGRVAGSVTAAMFLQRFVKDRPWAHLDIAGTALGAPGSEINQSWASGFGVRLLDRFIRNAIEANG